MKLLIYIRYLGFLRGLKFYWRENAPKVKDKTELYYNTHFGKIVFVVFVGFFLWALDGMIKEGNEYKELQIVQNKRIALSMKNPIISRKSEDGQTLLELKENEEVAVVKVSKEDFKKFKVGQHYKTN